MIYFFIAVLLILIFFLLQVFKIISGYAAKIVCSGVFVCERTAEDLLLNELGYFPLNLAKVSVDKQESSVTASVIGLAKKKAIFRTGLGATLINGISEKELRSQHYDIINPPIANQNGLNWPQGNLLPPVPKVNFDEQQLNKALDEAFTEPLKGVRRTRGVIVLYEGEIVAERYAENFSVNSKFAGWSLAKSVTNALIGILVKDKLLDVNSTAPVKEWKNDKRKVITIKDLMQMSSGLSWWEYYSAPSDATNMLYNKKSMGEFARQKKLKHTPGTKFNYSSGTTNILSAIVREKIDKEKYYQFPYERLFYKMNMSDTIMEVDAGGTFAGSSYCFATLRDWARFGLLYLNDGVWNGERILPEGWVDFTTTPTMAESGAVEGRYGAQWWVNAPKTEDPASKKYPNVPEDCFSCQGHEGQYIWVIRSEKLVVVRMALEKDKNLDPDVFLQEVIRAFKNKS